MSLIRFIIALFLIQSALLQASCDTEFRKVAGNPKAPLFVLSGPSGAGKTTVLREAMKSAGVPLRAAVSVTTRNPRPGEQDGKDYHFWTKEKFQDSVKKGEFLESQEVHGNFYGTLKSEVDDYRAKGTGVFLVIDVKGMQSMRKVYPDLVPIFLKTSTPEIFEKRLRARGTETEEAIQKRLKNAVEELKHINEFKHSVLNDDLNTAIKDLNKVIKSETGKFKRRKIYQILDSAFSLAASLALIGIPIVPEITGAITQTPHIGMSTYLDIDNIEGLLTIRERELLKDPVHNRNAIIDLFIRKLYPDYKLPKNSEALFVLFEPKMASSYLDPSNRDKGVCRNKALVLAAILNHYGIKAVVEIGRVDPTPNNGGGHAWVYLPETDEVADPTWWTRMPSEQYYSLHAKTGWKNRYANSIFSRWLGAYLR